MLILLLLAWQICPRHSMKSVQMRSYFWSVFSYIWTEYGDLLRKSGDLLRI